MNVLLVMRQIMTIRNGKVYCESALKPTLDRFMRLGNLHICSYQYTGKSAMPVDTLVDISTKKVDFLDNESSLKYRYFCRGHNRRLLESRIKEADLVIGYVPGTVCDLALDIAKKYGKKYLSFLVACIWDGTWYHANWKAKVMAPIFFYETRRTVKKSDYVWYVTEEFLQKRYPTNGISFGCTDTSLENLDESVLVKRLSRINSMESPLKLLTVGHLDVGFKGQQFVISALPALPFVEYYMIGGGDESRLLHLAQRLNVADRVHFVGKMNRAKVLEFMDTMDVYIQVSLQEGLPRSVAEAMSRAMPVIGSATGGIPEMIEKEYVTRRKSVADIIEIVQHMTKEDMLKQARRNFEKARDYQFANVNNKVNSFFSRIKQAMK